MTLPSLRAGPAAALDMSRALPEQLHVGAVVNVRGLVDDFPQVVYEGWLGRRIDEWVARGYPDPRQHLTVAGVGANLGTRELKDLLILGQGSMRVAPATRRMAERLHIPLKERAYRGTTFLMPRLIGTPAAFADVTDTLSLASWDRRDDHRPAFLTVDTLQGRNSSLGEVHDLALTEGTYVVGAVNVPVGVRQALAEDLGITGLRFLAQGSFAWRRGVSHVRLGSELRTWTSIEARLLARSLRKKLEKMQQEAEDERLKALLERVEIRRRGKAVQVSLVLEIGEAQAVLPALGALR